MSLLSKGLSVVNPISRLTGFDTLAQWAYNKLKPSKPNNSASKLRARIAREQWEDYKKRFQPLENILLGYAGNRQGYINQSIENSLEKVNQAYSGGQAQIERRLGSYGLQVSPEIQQRIAQRLGLQKNLSQVQASNMARREAESQLDTIVGGGLITNARGIEERN